MKYKPSIVAAYFAEMKLPPFVREHQFHPDRKWRFDFAFLEERVALEVEGGIFIQGRHSRGAGVAKDIEKYSEAAALGWLIVRCQPKDLCTLQTANLLKRACSNAHRRTI